MTATILTSGGSLDTMASIRSGFKVIWGSDNDTNMQKMWKNMTGMASLGPAENINYGKIQVPDGLLGGMPCPDWTSLGSERANKGITGHLYADQIKWILKGWASMSTRISAGYMPTNLWHTQPLLTTRTQTILKFTKMH